MRKTDMPSSMHWGGGLRRSGRHRKIVLAYHEGEREMKLIDPRLAGGVALMIVLSACVVPPMAPTIPVSPGANKQFSAFAADQSYCQQYAAAQTAPQAAAATNQAVGNAVLSTALGAGLGAAIGAATGSAGAGAAIGAASGATFGTVVGAGGAGYAQMSLQQQYDVVYGQCMAAQGNQVGGFSPPGTPPYAGTPGPTPYGPGPSPYGPSPSPYGPGPSPYGQPPYPGMPVPPPG
jgi:hypothetical protein